MSFSFPTETIQLPSQGKYYPKSHPLRENGGKLEIKYLTAKEEDIMTSTNLINNGTMFDKLLESIVVHPGVEYLDLTVSDVNAVIIASRVLAYGKFYTVEIECPSCKVASPHNIDLTLLESPDKLVDSDENGHYTFKTSTGLQVTLRAMTRRLELEVEKENKALEQQFSKSPTHEITSRLKRTIVSIDGEDDKTKLSSIINNLIVKDTSEIRKTLSSVNPRIDTSLTVECECGHSIKGDLPLSANFFWPEAEL